MRRTVLPPLVLVAFFLASPILRDATHAQDNSQVWPTKEWQTSPPEDQGMDSGALTQLVDMGAYTRMDSLLIVRHGKIVVEAYYAPFKSGIKHRMYSVTKSVLGTLIAIAAKDGLLNSVDHRVMDFFREHQIAKTDEPLAERLSEANFLAPGGGEPGWVGTTTSVRRGGVRIPVILNGRSVRS